MDLRVFVFDPNRGPTMEVDDLKCRSPFSVTFFRDRPVQRPGRHAQRQVELRGGDAFMAVWPASGGAM